MPAQGMTFLHKRDSVRAIAQSLQRQDFCPSGSNLRYPAKQSPLFMVTPLIPRHLNSITARDCDTRVANRIDCTEVEVLNIWLSTIIEEIAHVP